MTSGDGKARGTRRSDALSQDVVVAAAIDLLDERGERGLTVKLLTERLRTGAGAIYWHVGGKDELVALAADRVVGDALAALPEAPSDAEAEAELRRLALGMYDALEQHPWAAAHVNGLELPLNSLRLLERIGTLLAHTGLPADRHFAVATTLFNYLTGVTTQDIHHAPPVAPGVTREALLGRAAERWAALDPQAFPFLTRAAADLRVHDDRDQFVAGLDLLIDGLRSLQGSAGDARTTSRRGSGSPPTKGERSRRGPATET